MKGPTTAAGCLTVPLSCRSMLMLCAVEVQTLFGYTMLRQDWFSMQKDRRSCCKSQALHCEQQFALMLLECADGAAVLGKAGMMQEGNVAYTVYRCDWEHGYCTYQWCQESKLEFTCWTLQHSISSILESSTSHVSTTR